MGELISQLTNNTNYARKKPDETTG
jgi:hypothetical protein